MMASLLKVKNSLRKSIPQSSLRQFRCRKPSCMLNSRNFYPKNGKLLNFCWKLPLKTEIQEPKPFVCLIDEFFETKVQQIDASFWCLKTSKGAKRESIHASSSKTFSKKIVQIGWSFWCLKRCSGPTREHIHASCLKLSKKKFRLVFFFSNILQLM